MFNKKEKDSGIPPETNIQTADSNSEKKSRWKAFLNGKKLDYILLGVLSLAVILLVWALIQLSVLPSQIMLFIALILVLLILIIGTLIFKSRKAGKLRYFFRVVLILLSCGLFFADYTLFNSYSLLSSITTTRSSIVKTSLLVKSDSAYDNASSLENKKVGYCLLGDQMASSNAMEQLNGSAKNITYEQSDDYYSLYEQLTFGKIDALIIPNNRISILKEQFKNLSKDTKTIAEFETERQSAANTNSNVNITKEPFCVYIAGIDQGDDPSIDGRSDVNILVFIDPRNNQITTTSIPRDSYVPNPAYDNGSDKLTHLGNDGVENSVAGIEETFGIDINYYAKVNFQSLIHIVDALGGVDVDVKISFTEQDENRSFKKKDLITLEKGMQTLNGKQALAYARHRKTEGYSTTGRENAQQQVIKAIVKKLTSAEGISRINDVLQAASEYVYTNIPMNAIQSFVSYQLNHLKPWSIESNTLRTGVDATLSTASMPGWPLSCYLLSQQDINKVFNAYMRMFDDSKMKDFTFNLSTNPNNTIQYPQDQHIGEFVVTSQYAGELNPYTVYYGINKQDEGSSEAAQQRVEEYNVEIVTPPVYTPPVTPSYRPSTPSGGNYYPGGNTTPSTPTTPVTPSEPVVPETPVTPPSEPVVPETPVTPPVDPVVPETPATPPAAETNSNVPAGGTETQTQTP